MFTNTKMLKLGALHLGIPSLFGGVAQFLNFMNFGADDDEKRLVCLRHAAPQPAGKNEYVHAEAGFLRPLPTTHKFWYC